MATFKLRQGVDCEKKLEPAGETQFLSIVLFTDNASAMASCVAIARCFSLFSLKSKKDNNNNESLNVQVEIAVKQHQSLRHVGRQKNICRTMSTELISTCDDIVGLQDRPQIELARKAKLHVDSLSKDVLSEQYVAVVLPGGQPGSNNLAADECAGQVLRRHEAAGAIVAAICAALIALVAHGVAKGGTLTAYPAVKDQITAGGYTYSEDNVCVYNNVVTSRGPGVDVTIAGLQDRPQIELARKANLHVDSLSKDVLGEQYVAVVLPGGQPGSNNLAAGILCFLSSLLTGYVCGRMPFLLLTVFCACVSFIPCLSWWYFTLFILSGLFSVTFSVVFAYVANSTERHERGTECRLIATFTASLALGAYLSSVYSENAVVLLATCISALDMLFIAVCVPESLKPFAGGECSDGGAAGHSASGRVSLLKIKGKDPLFVLRFLRDHLTVLRLCAIVFLTEASQFSCFFVYPRLVVGFSPEAIALFVGVLQTGFLRVYNNVVTRRVDARLKRGCFILAVLFLFLTTTCSAQSGEPNSPADAKTNVPMTFKEYTDFKTSLVLGEVHTAIATSDVLEKRIASAIQASRYDGLLFWLALNATLCCLGMTVAGLLLLLIHNIWKISEDLQRLTPRISVIEQDLTTLTANVATLTANVATLSNNMDTRFANLDTRLIEFSHILTNAVIPRISALEQAAVPAGADESME
uniref:DJ-1/PfpI domain-containing protein n=1 Tax=Globodera rostochiensis TaxID=31243 RepID=A0A914HID2_GLORO